MSIIDNDLYYTGNSSANTIFRAPILSNGNLGAVQAIGGWTGTGGFYGLGAGHAGFGYASQFTGSDFQYVRFSTNTHEELGTFGKGINSSPWGNIEVIVAPEPAPVAALAIGALALIRRRRA